MGREKKLAKSTHIPANLWDSFTTFVVFNNVFQSSKFDVNNKYYSLDKIEWVLYSF